VPAVHVHVEPVDQAVAEGLAAIRAEMDVVDPPAAAIVEADAAAVAFASGRPVGGVAERVDLTGVPFVTLDPPGSRDLDQALHLSAEEGGGWTVFYAVADVAAFVEPGGALDIAARERGVTIYLPDAKSPLHPTSLSEGAASLLPDQDRPALVWRVCLDGDGEVVDVDVRRALVRSRGQFAYGPVQAALDAGIADEVFRLLRDAGQAREALQARRGGLDLRLPEQTVVAVDGTYELAYRAPLQVEGWNAQLSLLVGECAARLMLDAGVGVLRTMPPPSTETVERLRAHAVALGVHWPDGVGYAELVRGLDPAVPDQAALIVQSAKLARGAGYLAFTEPPEGDVTHAAVAAPYAHVTAPLRRLVDRFANELAVAACAGSPPPGWAVEALDGLPTLMGRAASRASAVERMVVSLAEAAVLRGHIGAEVDGIVVDRGRDRTTVQLVQPAVVAEIADHADVRLGEELRLRVVTADPRTREVVLEPKR
jgi:exoribonuclease R